MDYNYSFYVNVYIWSHILQKYTVALSTVDSYRG